MPLNFSQSGPIFHPVFRLFALFKAAVLNQLKLKALNESLKHVTIDSHKYL